MNLASILKMFGVKITPEQVKKLEELAPQIPGIVAEVVRKVDAHIAHTDMRLMAIEARLERIEHGIERNNGDDDYIRPAGAGGLSEPLSAGSQSESEPSTEQIDEVATVADEILVEVKECRTHLNQTMAALEALQSEGGPAKQSQITALETELRNTREELRNLIAELKALQSPQSESLRDSSQSIPSTSITQVEVIDPVGEENQAAKTAPSKKKRFRRI